MGLLSIAVLALYLTGIVLFISTNYKQKGNISKKDVKWYIIGYIITALIWPILYIIAFITILKTKKSE